MRIGRILYPISELGPGNRIGIWVQGCDRACPGCANPELWPNVDNKEIPISILCQIISAAISALDLDGITITGGEPFLQIKELRILLEAIKPICNDILVFTGFTYSELLQKEDDDIAALLSLISVLVDGEYRMNENKGERLRGSCNQEIHYFDPSKKELYEQYQHGKRTADHFLTEDGVVFVGIHSQQFMDNLSLRNKPIIR